MTAPRPEPVRNSFLKAVVLTLVCAVPVLVLAIMSGKDPERAGYLFGYYWAPFLFSGIIVGIWAKVTKHAWNWGHYIVRFGAIAVVIFVLNVIGQAGRGVRESTVVTELEKQHLVLSATDAHHTDYGFVVPLPNGSFQFDEDLQQRANQEFAQRGVADQTYTWVLSKTEPREVLMLMVTKGIGNSEAALRGMGRGITRGAANKGTQVLEDTLEWSANAHEYRFAATTQGMYVRARCMSSRWDPLESTCRHASLSIL